MWPDPLPLRLLIHRVLRAQSICAGSEEGPESHWSRRGCHTADRVRCVCGHTWRDEDPSQPRKCERCGALPLVVERCDTCPLNTMDEARNRTPAGHLLDRVIDLDFASDAFTVDYRSVTADLFIGLKMFREERNAYQIEHMKTEKERMEEEARIAELKRRTGR